MKIELVQKLREDFPELMNSRDSYPEVGNGWYDILNNLLAKLQELNLGPDFRIEQIKEKFGGLRFYYSGATNGNFNKIDELVNEAEKQASVTCEYCGNPGKIKNPTWGHGWIQCVCPLCDEREPNRFDNTQYIRKPRN